VSPITRKFGLPFIDDDKVEGIKFAGALVDRLNPRDSDRLIGIAAL